MQSLKKMSSDLQDKIRQYAKNGIDISSIIEGYSLKGENLSHCIIKNIRRIDEDLTGVDLSFAKIGSEGTKNSYFLRCKINDSNFAFVNFFGNFWVRSCEIRNCNFKNSILSNVDYRNSDFTNSIFCDTVMRIGTSEGMGCKFSKEFFEQLVKGWKVKVEVIGENHS